MAEFYNLGIRPQDLQSYKNFNQPDNPTIRTLANWIEEGDVLMPTYEIDLDTLGDGEVAPWGDDGIIRTNAFGELKYNEQKQVRATRNPFLAVFQAVYLFHALATPEFRGHAGSRPLRDGQPPTEPPVGIECFVSRALHDHVLAYAFRHPWAAQGTVLRLAGERFTPVREGYAAYAEATVEEKDRLAVCAADLGVTALQSYRDPLSDETIREMNRARGVRMADIAEIDAGSLRGQRLLTVGDYSAYDTFHQLASVPLDRGYY